MTKQEFIDYLNSFNKDCGEFTEDEMYKIGCKYKELPVSDKDWEWLVGKLGPKNDKNELKSGETFRIWIKGKQYADGSIKKNVHMLSGSTIESLSFEDFEKKTEEIKDEIYKSMVKERDYRNERRRENRAEARAEHFEDRLFEALKATAPLEPIKSRIASVGKTKEAVMLFSDVHLGVKLDTFYNKYNSSLARLRIQKYVDDTIELCKINNVQRLNFINLGDCVAGLIHITGRLEQEDNVIQQVITVSQILADALNQLQAAAPEVIYRSCTDNHSRAVADYKQNLEAENFGKFIDFYLEGILKDTNIKFVHDNLDDEIGLFELMNGQKMLFVHGHHDNYNTVAQAYLGATKEYIDYICLGHFHSSKLKTFQGIKVIVNGSIVGSEQYAYSKRLFGEPEQTLMIFDGSNVSINYINLNIKE